VTEGQYRVGYMAEKGAESRNNRLKTKSNVILNGAPFIFRYSAGKSERSPSMEIDVKEGTGEAVKYRFSRARRVNTARQSKGLPSSHYLIIDVILNRCKSHLQTGIVTSRRLGMLSNDLLEREDPLCV